MTGYFTCCSGIALIKAVIELVSEDNDPAVMAGLQGQGELFVMFAFVVHFSLARHEHALLECPGKLERTWITARTFSPLKQEVQSVGVRS